MAYNSEFTGASLDKRLKQGYYDDMVTAGFTGTKDQLDKLIAREWLSGTATSVANIDVNKKIVKVTLSLNDSFSIAVSGAEYNNWETTVYIIASGADRVVSIPTTGNYISMIGSSLTIPSGKWAEINVVCVDGIWHIARLDQE